MEEIPMNIVEARRLAHHYFDQIWKRKVKKGVSEKQARGKAYRWLAKELGISPSDTHMSRFDFETCCRVIEICKQYCM